MNSITVLKLFNFVTLALLRVSGQQYCAYNNPAVDTFLGGLACNSGNYNLEDAKMNCCSCSECGGVTCGAQVGSCHMRRGLDLISSPNDETSYLKAGPYCSTTRCPRSCAVYALTLNNEFVNGCGCSISCGCEGGVCILEKEPCTYPQIDHSNSFSCGTTEAFDTCGISCDSGYTLNGLSTITCRPGMGWSELPTCQESTSGKKIPSIAVDQQIRAQLRKVFNSTNGSVAGFLRLSYHDAGTFNIDTQTGGAHGCIAIPNGREINDPENKGLTFFIDTLRVIHTQFQNEVSMADIIHLAGVAAVEFASPPNQKLKVPFNYGRIDCEDLGCGSADCGVDLGRLPMAEPRRGPLGESNGQTCPNGPSNGACSCDGTCWNVQRTHMSMDFFGRMGFRTSNGSTDDRAMTALLGAHTLGGVHKAVSGYDSKSWTDQPATFDNGFYTNLLSTGSSSGWVFQQIDNSHTQSFGDDPTSRNPSTAMLVSDVTLQFFGDLESLCQEYAQDQAAFFRDFAQFYQQLTENGNSDLQAAGSVLKRVGPEEDISLDIRNHSFMNKYRVAMFGGVVGLLSIGGAIFFTRRRRKYAVVPTFI